MEFNQDQIAAIIGQKELEIIALRMEVARLNALIPKATDLPGGDNVTQIKEA